MFTEEDLVDLLVLKIIDSNPQKAIEIMKGIQMTKETRKIFCLLVAKKYRKFGKMPKEVEIYLSSQI